MNYLTSVSMFIRTVILGLIAVCALASWTSVSAAEMQPEAPDGSLAIELDTSEVSTLTGDRFTITSTVTNPGSDTTPDLVISLNFTSLDGGTYVDPEDWSPQRTQYVEPIEPGATVSQTWTVNPVLEGQIAAYIVVISDTTETAIQPLGLSPVVHLDVGAQKSLNPGGVAPVAIAVPGALAALLAAARLSRRRQRMRSLPRLS